MQPLDEVLNTTERILNPGVHGGISQLYEQVVQNALNLIAKLEKCLAQISELMSNEITPFEAIRLTNSAGNKYWFRRNFARVLSYTDDRNFEAVNENARTAHFNRSQRVEDHFVGITEMIGIGQGGHLRKRGKALHGDAHPLEVALQNLQNPETIRIIEG